VDARVRSVFFPAIEMGLRRATMIDNKIVIEAVTGVSLI
jgi:hypothetical protein